MAKPELMVVRDSRVPALAMAKGFKGYKPEDEKAARTAQVVENETLKKMKAAWKAFRYNGQGIAGADDAMPAVKGLDCSASDIESFSLALAGFQDEEEFSGKAGLFLSALMKNCKEDAFVIHTSHFAKPIHNLGYENTKNITVDGDIGSYVGAYMKGGSIIVEGNAGLNPAFLMKNGTITVKGDAGAQVGGYMGGGLLTVNGNAGEGVGAFMRGGEVHIEGDCPGISGSFQHGKIFHKGELIMDK